MAKKRAEAVVKVYPEEIDWIRDEQYRLRKLTGREPSQPEIIADLVRRCREQNNSENSQSVALQYQRTQISERHSRAREAFEEVMASGDEPTMRSLEANAYTFQRLIRLLRGMHDHVIAAQEQVAEAERILSAEESQSAPEGGAEAGRRRKKAG